MYNNGIALVGSTDSPHVDLGSYLRRQTTPVPYIIVYSNPHVKLSIKLCWLLALSLEPSGVVALKPKTLRTQSSYCCSIYILHSWSCFISRATDVPYIVYSYYLMFQREPSGLLSIRPFRAVSKQAKSCTCSEYEVCEYLLSFCICEHHGIALSVHHSVEATAGVWLTKKKKTCVFAPFIQSVSPPLVLATWATRYYVVHLAYTSYNFSFV